MYKLCFLDRPSVFDEIDLQRRLLSPVFLSRNDHALTGKPLHMLFVKVLIVQLLRSYMVLHFNPTIMNIIFCQWTFAHLVILDEPVSLVRQQYALSKHDAMETIHKLYTLELVCLMVNQHIFMFAT